MHGGGTPAAGAVLGAPPGTARHSSFNELLAAMMLELDDVLATLPANRLEARREIIRQLGFEPRAEELQAIVSVATDAGAEGPRRKLPRRLLALRILADRQIRTVLGAESLDPTGMRAAVQHLPALVSAAEDLQEIYRGAVEARKDMFLADRDFLLQVGEALELPHDELAAAHVVGPWLARFAESVSEGTIDEDFPSMTAGEREQLRGAVDAASRDEAPGRVCIVALGLCEAMEQGLQLFDRSFGEGVDEEEQRSQRERALDELKRGQDAYHVISRLLQRQQDTALMAGLNGFAEELRAVGRRMFGLHLEIQPVLRNPDVSRSDRRAAEATPPDPEILERIRAAETEAAAVAAERVSEEELYVGALKNIRDRPAARPPESVAARSVRQERLRFRALIGCAVVLAAISIGLQVALYQPRAPEPEITAREFPPRLAVDDVESAGPLLFTETDKWSEWTPQQRQAHTNELGRVAGERGYEFVFVVDDRGNPVASWNKRGGTRVWSAPEPPPGDLPPW